MEWVRLQIMCGFSWNPIGLALTHFTPSLQFSSVFGVLGLSFWVIMTNLVGLKALEFKGRHIFSWVALAAVPYLFGYVQLNYFPKKENPALDVALIQTNLLPSEKVPYTGRIDDFISPFSQWERILNYLREKSHYDLIVLPEAALPMSSEICSYSYFMAREILIEKFGADASNKLPPLCPPFAEQRLVEGRKVWYVSNLFWCQALANLYDAEVLAGLDHCERSLEKNFNSAFYFQPHHFLIQRYDKQVLLPIAEYLPWDALRPLAKNYGINDFFSRGSVGKVFGEKIPFSPSICYEETFSEKMRKGRSDGAQLFVNISNDNYFPDSSLHQQHLFHARVRAVENGISLVRACNSGVTAVIDGFGRMVAKLETDEGVLNLQLEPFQFPTLFSFWGEAGMLSLCLIFFLHAWRTRINFI
jgi:apolipoprotein N-acyltransferase